MAIFLRPIGDVLDLVSLADSVEKFSADCRFCSNSAIFTLRTVEETRVEVVGGADKYAPACRNCYVTYMSANSLLEQA